MSEIELEIFSKRLKELRISLKLTQKKFAEELSITAAALSAYEKGDINPSIGVAIRIAETYHVSIDWLCGLTEKKHRDGEFMTVGDITSLLLEMSNYIGNASVNIIGIESGENGTGATITFANPYIVDFLIEWKKMKELHDNNIIDNDVYNLWVEKTLEKNKTILLKKENIE